MIYLIILGGVIVAGLYARNKYLESKSQELKAEVIKVEEEKKAITYENSMHNVKEEIVQTNANNDDDIRQRMRNKNYSRPKN